VAADTYGLIFGPITLYGQGEISTRRLMECLEEWVGGRTEWKPEDFGLTQLVRESPYEGALRDSLDAQRNLSAVQARCTELLEENRQLKAIREFLDSVKWGDLSGMSLHGRVRSLYEALTTARRVRDRQL
jgi:hypothetical protein